MISIILKESGNFLYKSIYNILKQMGIDSYIDIFTYAISWGIVLGLGFVLCFIIRYIVLKISGHIVKRTDSTWMRIFYKNKFFQSISNFIFPITISVFSDSLPDDKQLMGKLLGIVNAVVIALLIKSLSNIIDELYCQYEISKIRPIRGLIQIVSAITYAIICVATIAVLMGESPVVLLGGIGAMAAVISFVFKDPILGFVAGIQLVSNDMIRIGDWIEVPDCAANGRVIELSMTTVKVENFDKTVTTIPAYMLITDSFINFRNMLDFGGRRIKRVIRIDISTIKVCDEQMIESFKKMSLPIGHKELKQMTNIGVFRLYMQEYLKSHPQIRDDMPIMVRHMEPDEAGAPIEVYCFANTSVWVEYEGVQSEVFEHIYAVVPNFQLRVFQKPSGKDLCCYTIPE